MSLPILTTKLYIPPPRPHLVLRPRLIERLSAGLHHKLSLISAPAGFGKTTLVRDWVAGCGRPVAWLSLDEGDSDPARFLAYLVARRAQELDSGGPTLIIVDEATQYVAPLHRALSLARHEWNWRSHSHSPEQRCARA